MEGRQQPDSQGQTIERRTGTDRRSPRGAFRLAASSDALRRQVGRRREDLEQGYYTDRYDAPLLLTAMSLLLFAALDSILTLQLLARGAEELNPLMRMLLDIDVWAFAWGKMVITALVLVVLVSHANYKVFGLVRVRRVLLFVLMVNIAVVAYQTVLITTFAPLPDPLLLE